MPVARVDHAMVNVHTTDLPLFELLQATLHSIKNVIIKHKICFRFIQVCILSDGNARCHAA
jgi:hypothetical protein